MAEKYLTDEEYEVGTVVMIGGDKEVTKCQPGFRSIGVVSENPAFMMNKDLEGGTYIALKGRVPVKVIGPVRKGDRLVSGSDGCAIVDTSATGDTFSVALETNLTDDVKLVESVVL